MKITVFKNKKTGTLVYLFGAFIKYRMNSPSVTTSSVNLSILTNESRYNVIGTFETENVKTLDRIVKNVNNNPNMLDFVFNQK